MIYYYEEGEADEEEEEDEGAHIVHDRDEDLHRELHRLREVEIALTNEISQLRAQIDGHRRMNLTLQESLLEASWEGSRDGRDPGLKEESALAAACRSGDVELVDALLATDANAQTLACALQAACQHRRGDLVEHLVRRCDDAVVRADHDSALLWACRNGDEDIARTLLDRGANPSTLSGCPLRLAVRGGFHRVARLLVDAGARPDQ